VIGQVQEGADAGVTVLGDTVNFAARLQSLAAPGSVFMSEATHRLLQGFVERASLANIPLRANPSHKRSTGSIRFASGPPGLKQQ
jgi:class 3 adenylate cyclase